jgi:chemotaxis protein methyltransferase CheR
MSPVLEPELLKAVSHSVETRLGLHYPQERWIDLERGLGRAAKELGFETTEQCAREMVDSRLGSEQLDSLAAHLTIGETYFFRDPAAFTALETQVIPEFLLARRGVARHLRIWSAGCCTGEEAYSIAISLRRTLPAFKEWHVSILATDVNSRFLQKALQGVYGQWSFRGVPDSVKRAYFKRTREGRFEVVREIRQMVEFSCLNLVEDVFPALTTNTNALDIIFCRNVLMYFSRDQMRHVSEGLTRSLVDGGWLFVSPAEASQELFPALAPVRLPGTSAFRKAPATPPEMPAFVDHEWPIEATGLPLSNGASATVPIESAVVTSSDNGPARPRDRDELMATARKFANEGRLVEALAACDDAIAMEKLCAASHYLRGVILHEQNGIEEAIAAIKRALYLDHDFVVAHFALSNLMLRIGGGREAKRSIENARELLVAHEPDTVLPESDGITAGRMLAMLDSMQEVVP